jgi:hypothetical protein
VNYFDGWSGPLSGFHFQGLVSGSFAGRRPLSGWRDNTVASMRAALSWARDDGADFFFFDWYYHGELSSDPSLNQALANYRALPDHHGVGFALDYIDLGEFAVPPSEWGSVVEQWVREDFSNPDYARVDGKPILLIWDAVSFDRQFGGTAGVNAALDTLRQAAIAHGLPGVFVVAGVFMGDRVDRLGWDYWAQEFAGERFDALTQNAYPAAAGERDSLQPYADLVAAGEAGWQRSAETLGFRTIPTVMDGWDPRPWNEAPDGHLWWFDRTPAQFASFVRTAIDWVLVHPDQRVEVAPTPPVVLLIAWNELGEGEYLVPTVADGYAYGQALAEAIGVPWVAPVKHALTVSVHGKGGSVRSSPTGIGCPGTCATSFDNGWQITLTALAKRGFVFRGWSGGCRGRSPTCTFLIEQNRSVQATFKRRR